MTVDARPPSRSPSAGPVTVTPPVITPAPRSTFGPPGAGVPGEPAEVLGFVVDRSSAAFAGERRTIADDYASLVLERPFTQQAMDYLPFVDILRAEIAADAQWVYVSISLVGAAPAGAPVVYAVELDVDRDGRGDWLIVAATPLASAWTHDGVQVLQDADRDVGGARALAPDAPDPQADGYEMVAYGTGDEAGVNPAWARLSLDPSARVQFALSRDWLGDEAHLLWGVWADAGLRNPRLFDYHDRFTGQEAGSPLSSSADYPLKRLASVDNSCRWVFGFAPAGSEPGLCRFEPPTPIPSATLIPVAPTP